uniref:Uncharacterized protein n=1 Tax=Triticum urartu TaxID=4572 RepID=A0A8R7JVQ0_TRIUA
MLADHGDLGNVAETVNKEADAVDSIFHGHNSPHWQNYDPRLWLVLQNHLLGLLHRLPHQLWPLYLLVVMVTSIGVPSLRLLLHGTHPCDAFASFDQNK